MIALRKTALSVAATALAAFAISSQNSGANATVNFNSQIGGHNLQSNGAPMDSAFAFQIGTFTGGFAPSANNTDQWLSHWVALADAAADPLPEATAIYSTYELPFGTTTSGFTGSTELDHNQPPFQAMGAVYVWAYDNRTVAGEGEWMLLTSSSWGWPVGTTNPPATTFSVSDADTVILGAVDGDDFHMQSAAVTVSEVSTPGGYDAWLAEHFDAGTLADADAADRVWGVLADPDSDGLSNVIEFFTASDPTDPNSKRDTAAAAAGDDLEFTFYQAKDTSGVLATVEWSSDMVHWQTEGVETADVEDLGDVYRVTTRISTGTGADKFARLNVRRAFD